VLTTGAEEAPATGFVLTVVSVGMPPGGPLPTKGTRMVAAGADSPALQPYVIATCGADRGPTFVFGQLPAAGGAVTIVMSPPAVAMLTLVVCSVATPPGKGSSVSTLIVYGITAADSPGAQSYSMKTWGAGSVGLGLAGSSGQGPSELGGIPTGNPVISNPGGAVIANVKVPGPLVTWPGVFVQLLEKGGIGSMGVHKPLDVLVAAGVAAGAEMVSVSVPPAVVVWPGVF